MLLMQKLHSCPQEVPCEYKASPGQGDLGSEIHFAGDPWGSGIPLCGLQPLSLTWPCPYSAHLDEVPALVQAALDLVAVRELG